MLKLGLLMPPTTVSGNLNNAGTLLTVKNRKGEEKNNSSEVCQTSASRLEQAIMPYNAVNSFLFLNLQMFLAPSQFRAHVVNHWKL